ncbi:hypothetical protein [Macrococcus capreoli]|uniref:hypothetical protein n=1 Tax=Macrococcus capreoli TaxID=2982690 RepID=UPI0021D5FA45|nr:hypothetical protein [Macrococcus sp. TMW 2.2395]MCU7557274.1 hypothetical protein [Macrococcus sp. TMW 2.2395]
MIKVGDKVIWQSKEWEVYSIEEHIVELRRIEDGFGIGTKVDLKFLESNYFKQLYEQQKQRADELEKRLKETVKIALDRLIIINNFKEFICESIDNAKEDCKKDTHLSNHVWLKALQYVYSYAVKH